MLDFDGPNDWVELERMSSDRKELSPEERSQLWLAAVLLLAVICGDWP